MKTIFVHRKNDFTGSTRALAAIIEADYAGQDVSVICLNENGHGCLSGLPNVKIVAICYPKIRGKPVKYLSYLFSRAHMFFLALIVGRKFDVFYINTITPYPAAIAAMIMGKKMIYHVHEKFLDQSFETRIMEFVFYRARASRVFVSDYVRHMFPSVSCPTSIRYNTLSASFLADIRATPAENRSRRNILMMSSLAASKGIFQFARLAMAMPQYIFVLVLSAPEDEVAAAFGSYRVANLKVFSEQSDVHPFYREADLVVNLTNPLLCIETFGMTILEAMVYGVPAIAPNIGGPRELICDGYNGYLVDVNDIESVRVQIMECLEEDNYHRLVKNCFARANCFLV